MLYESNDHQNDWAVLDVTLASFNTPRVNKLNHFSNVYTVKSYFFFIFHHVIQQILSGSLVHVCSSNDIVRVIRAWSFIWASAFTEKKYGSLVY